MQLSSTTQPGRWLRWLILGAVLLLLSVGISGCFGGGQAAALEPEQFQALGKDMVAIEQMDAAGREEYAQELEGEFDQFEGIEDGNERARSIARNRFLLGYVAEYNKTTEELADPDASRGVYREARDQYRLAVEAGSGYGSQAAYRLGVLAERNLIGSPDESAREAKQRLRPLTLNHQGQVWARQPALAGEGGAAALAEKPAETGVVLYPQEMSSAASNILDTVYRTAGGLDTTYYRAVDTIVGFFRKISPKYATVLALFFLALVVKLITLPLTTMAFRGMRDMQRVQPLLKELQEKYKDDRAKLAEEQMKLMKEHKVSPAGGCLPMLIQFPIFIAVYQAVQVYSAQFAQTPFLWIDSLARPDWPLLILYTVSMIITQKLTTMPSTDPQQKMMQQQMTYVMPIIFVFILQTIASAFVLYWFFLNVLSSAHQYYLMHKFRQEEATTGKPTPANTGTGAVTPRRNAMQGRKKGKKS